jgi:tetratricopeptide (TPR) repeat protein
LSKENRALALGEAGHYLFILGRYEEAQEPLENALDYDRQMDQEALCRAARYARLLRELHLVRGDFSIAQRFSEDGVELARRSKDQIHLMLNLAAKAQVLHYRGAWKEAEDTFSNAEEIQKLLSRRDSPEQSTKLFGVAGFWYTEFLIDSWERNITATKHRNCVDNFLHRPAKTRQLKSLKVLNGLRTCVERAENLIQEAKSRAHWTLDCGHGELVLGLALFRLSKVTGKRDALKGLRELDQALADLRMTGQQHHLAHAFEVRARCRSEIGDLEGAKADLAEAWQIAERSGMKIFMAEALLLQSRLFHDKNALGKARKIIEQTGYWRLKNRLEHLESRFTNSEKLSSDALHPA